MQELSNIRTQVPEDIARRLLPDEPVYYYSTASGCLGMGGKEWFALTNPGVLMTTAATGCLGMRKVSGTMDIPLEHIASVSSGTEKGCLASGGPLSLPRRAQRAAGRWSPAARKRKSV